LVVARGRRQPGVPGRRRPRPGLRRVGLGRGAGAAVRRLPHRHPPGARPRGGMTGGEGDGGGTTPWPRDERTAALLAELPGLEIVRMIIAHPEWVHRRVDFIDYRDDTTFRRRQSIHFTVPAAAPEIRVSEARFRLIPLTTLNKATLVNSNCRDEADSALPILTRRQQGLLIVRGMTAWADAVVGAPLADDVAAEIDGRLTGQEGTRETARAAFDSGGGQRAVLRDDDIFALVLERLTDQSPL